MKKLIKTFKDSMFTVLLFILSVMSTDLFSQQWVQVGTLSTSASFLWKDISVVDSNVVWACGNNKVWRTVNGGANWTEFNGSGITTNPIFAICAKDSLTAFLGDVGGNAGGNAKIFKTTNGGNNWIFIDSTGGSHGWISGIVFSKTNPNFGFIVSDPPFGPGTPFYYSKSTNGGQTWASGSIPGVFDAFTVSDGTFCINSLFYGFLIEKSNMTDSARIYFTTNGGLNWIIRGTSPSYATTVAGYCDFNDDKNTGIFTIQSMLPNIAKTTNGGLNWVLVNTGLQGYGAAVINWITGTNKVFLFIQSSALNQYVYRSDNNGLTWNLQSTPSVMGGVINASFVKYQSKICGYAITQAGRVFRTVQDTIVGIRKISQEIPDTYNLYQNYPNPFNAVTSIKFQVASVGQSSQTVSLRVFDLLGREVTTLVNEKLQPGTYEVTFDAGNLPSGVYFYQFKSGDFINTKKLILLK